MREGSASRVSIIPPMTARETDDAGLIVLTGVGRSGTTALLRALGEHPGVRSSGHAHNVVFDVLEAGRINRTLPSRRAAMQLGDEAHDALFRKLILDLVLPSTDRPDGTRRGRTPLLFTNLTPDAASYLLGLFPEARVLCLVRSGTEVVRSRMRHPVFGTQPFEQHCRAWANAGAMHAWAQARPRCLCVRYESVRDSPEQACEEIHAFCGLSPSPLPALHLRSRTYHPTPAGAPDGWTRDEHELFVSLCGEAMEQLGYSIPAPPGSPADDGRGDIVTLIPEATPQL